MDNRYRYQNVQNNYTTTFTWTTNDVQYALKKSPPQKKSPHFSVAFTDMLQKVYKFFLYRYYLPLCLV
jgi:hypothetical protein